MRIAGALHGDVKAVLRVEDMAADFTGLMRRAADIIVLRSCLRLCPDRRFRIASVTEVSPDHVELSLPSPPPVDGEQAEVPLGAWRRYELSLRFASGQLPVGDEPRAAAIELLAETPAGDLAPQADEALVVRQHAEALAPVTAAANQVADSFQKAARRPDEIEITIGVTLDAKLGAVISSASAGAHLDVTLRWHAPEKESLPSAGADDSGRAS